MSAINTTKPSALQTRASPTIAAIAERAKTIIAGSSSATEILMRT